MTAIKINLLPREYAPPRRAGVRDWVLVAGAIAGLMGAGLYYMGVAADITQTQSRVEQQEQQLSLVRAQLTEAALIGDREERVTKAEGELRGLVGRRWSNLLLTLRDLTPQHVTWQTVTAEGDRLTLKAESRGMVDVAQLFAGLINQPSVAEVTLRHVGAGGILVLQRVTAGAAANLPPDLQPLIATDELRGLLFELEIRLQPQEGGEPRGA